MEAAERDDSLAIGEALGLLRAEFPDISISKIRFLESKGLIAPERTTSGFRRFLPSDIERLQAILRMQRDQYLPLKIIREQFGIEPETTKPARRYRSDRSQRPDQQKLDLGESNRSAESSEISESQFKDQITPHSTKFAADAVDGRTASQVHADDAVPKIGDSYVVGALREIERSGGDKRRLRIVQDGEFSNTHQPSASSSEVNSTRGVRNKASQESEPETQAIRSGKVSATNANNASKTITTPKSRPLPPGDDATLAVQKSRSRVPAMQSAPTVAKESLNAPSTNRRSRQVGTNAGREQSKSHVELEIPPGYISARDFQRETSTTVAYLSDLDQFGIIKPLCVGNNLVYAIESIELARVAKSLSGLGFTPRHLKSLRVSIEKEFGLIEQLVATQLGVGGARAKRRAREVANLLDAQTAEFRSQMLGSLLRGIFTQR